MKEACQCLVIQWLGAVGVKAGILMHSMRRKSQLSLLDYSFLLLECTNRTSPETET